jgi:hypothetical protein
MLFAQALFDQEHSGNAILLMIAVSVIAVLDNGLEATAITEFAGPSWSGRALGVQNTAQRLMAATATPLFATLFAASQYPLAWILCGLFPLCAIPLVPARALRSQINERQARACWREDVHRKPSRAEESDCESANGSSPTARH